MGEKEYYKLNSVNDILSGARNNQPQSTTIRIEDANTETARALVPQMGSDDEWLTEGKIDWRRFSHLDDVDPLWIPYFMLIPKYQGGSYTKQYAELYANLMYSVNGRHKKSVVDMQKAVSGKADTPTQPKKNRSFLDKVLGKNKDERVD